MSTEAELGYHDAIHQISRSMQRRLKALEDEAKAADESEQNALKVRMDEIKHLLQVVESLRR